MKKALIMAIALLSIWGLFSCSNQKFNVDYCGQKELFNGAKDSYRSGKKVILSFDMIATDTDYSFTIDGKAPERIHYDNKKGYVIEFTMPAHDIKVECTSRNSMTYIPVHNFEDNFILVNYFTKITGTPEESLPYELVLRYSESENGFVIDEYISSTEKPDRRFYAPYSCYEECLDIFNDEKMYKWDKLKNPVCIDGRITVVRIFDGENHCRMSTEQMPQDGEKILGRIESTLLKYMNDENLISE